MNKSNFLTIILLIAGLLSFSQTIKKTDEIKIQTSAQCGQCKTRIETALAYEKGIIKSVLDLDTKILTVEYKVSKTTPDKIRKAVAAIGYDADEISADEQAYKKLPPCCKKPDDPEHISH